MPPKSLRTVHPVGLRALLRLPGHLVWRTRPFTRRDLLGEAPSAVAVGRLSRLQTGPVSSPITYPCVRSGRDLPASWRLEFKFTHNFLPFHEGSPPFQAKGGGMCVAATLAGATALLATEPVQPSHQTLPVSSQGRREPRGDFRDNKVPPSPKYDLKHAGKKETKPDRKPGATREPNGLLAVVTSPVILHETQFCHVFDRSRFTDLQTSPQ